MARILLLFILVAGVLSGAKAQDPHFSQFFASPLTLTPAFTGKINGTIRVAANYRNQWPTINKAFQTTSASVDFAILRNRIPFTDTWGVGLAGFSDQSANGAVKFNYASASTAYHKGLDEDGYHQVGVGFQVTYANMIINTSQLKFEDQLTSSGFTGVTGEIFNNSTLKGNYIDLNAGLLYTGSTNDNNNFYGGISMYHINRPKQAFTGANYLLQPRLTLHGGGYFPVGETSFIHLSGLYSTQAGANETVIGGAFQHSIGTETMEKPIGFYAGAWVRMNDALIPYVGLEFSDFRLGVSYDVNTSNLKTASQSRGGIELSLIYMHKPAEGRSIPCPKF